MESVRCNWLAQAADTGGMRDDEQYTLQAMEPSRRTACRQQRKI